MRKIFTLLTIIIVLSSQLFAAGPKARTFHLAKYITEADYWHGKIIFKVRQDYRGSCSRSAVSISSLNEKMALLRVDNVEKKFPNQQPPIQSRSKAGLPMTDLSLIYELKYNANLSIEKAVTLLLQDESIEYAEP